MDTKDRSPFRAGGRRLYTFLPAALFCALFLYACDFPGAPPNGERYADFSGNPPASAVSGDPPASDVLPGDPPASAVSGNPPASAVPGDPPASAVSGNPPASAVSGNPPASDVPGNPPDGESYLAINLSGASGTRNARSVLSNNFISNLRYKVTFTSSPGGTVIERDVEGERISVALSAGEWVITAKAYQIADGGAVLAGTGTAGVTLVPGQYQSIIVLMYVDPDFEDDLTDIYIHNEAELRRVGTSFAIGSTMRFYLEYDIVLASPWTPIGDDGTPFKAVFDGDGHTITISSFTPAALNGAYLGLFGYADGATIQNLTVVYNNLTASSSYADTQCLGGIAARAMETLIDDVHVRGSIEYTASESLYIGGLVGSAWGNSGSSTDTQIYNSSFAGVLKGTGGYMIVSAGGILGSSHSGTSENAKIEGSYAAGIINATSTSSTTYEVHAGGIAGDGACNIMNCYSAAEVAASASFNHAYAGGIIGNLTSGVTVFGKCYALGTVSAASSGSDIYAGGIAGKSVFYIANCVALADVNATASGKGGYVIGDLTGGSGTNFAALEKTLTRGSSPNDLPGTSHPVADLKGPSNTKYPTDLSWNFTTDWKWLSGYDYPVLEWQTIAPDTELANLGLSGFTWF